MTIKQYIPLALRTESVADFPNSRLLHAALGLATEAVELLNATESENAIEELGDICWYAAVAYDTMGCTDEPAGDVLQRSSLAALAEQLASAIKAHIWYNRPLDNAKSLPGLILACAQATYKHHTNPSGNIFDLNIAKLRARYPDRYTDAAANNRNLQAEANALRAKILAGSTAPKPV